MKIVCLGDSLTCGYGVSPEDSWCYLLNMENNHHWINKGVNGDTTSGMLSRFYPDVLSLNPKKLFILGGDNDFICGSSLDGIKSNIMTLTHQARHHGIDPILLSPPPIYLAGIPTPWKEFNNFSGFDAFITEYTSWLKDFSKSFEFPYIHLFHDFTLATKNFSKENLYLDGLHPTALGHKIIKEIISSYL